MADLDLGQPITSSDDYTWLVPSTGWYLVHIWDSTGPGTWGDPSTVTLKQNTMELTDLDTLSADTMKVVALRDGLLTVTVGNLTNDRPVVDITPVRDGGW